MVRQYNFIAQKMKVQTVLSHPTYITTKEMSKTPVTYLIEPAEIKPEAQTEEAFVISDQVGKKLTLTHTGKKYCIHCARSIPKTFNEGYCFPCMRSLAQCDMCIVKPELCHFAEGTCREPEWGEKHCYSAHIVYLAISSEVKVGITRKINLPSRFIDQGASFALPVFEVESRHLAGLLEVKLKALFTDKTNFRKMLSRPPAEGEEGAVDPRALFEGRERILSELNEMLVEFSEEHGPYALKMVSSSYHLWGFEYPIVKYLDKITSINLDKNPSITSTLLGIKGQYLIFEEGVVNLRKYTGYQMTLEVA